jgi:cystathionine gamma-synthase
VRTVHYPGLPDDPGNERAMRIMGGFGAMLAVELYGDAEFAEAVCRRVRVFTHAKGLGGIESLIDRRARCRGSSAPQSLLRLSIGGEHVTDLWHDLNNALTEDQK